MYLNKEEEQILSGEEGEIPAKAMRILTILGDMFGAQNLVPVESVQVSGISYKTIGDAGLEFLESWSSAKVNVETRMNPAGMDLQAWQEMGISKEFAEKQLKIISALTKMGIRPSCSCTPYHAGLVPREGSHIAWAESSAVCFANSVLGAMTNREGGPSALSAAIIGKTPNYGLHLEENRRADFHIKIDFPLSFFDYTLLGYHIGKTVKNKIPAIEGIKTTDWTKLKLMGAAMAAGGGVPMFMIKDVTPEYKLKDNVEEIHVDKSDLEKIRQLLNTGESADVISFGCPHCSYEEIQDILKNVKTKKKVWICTSREVKNRIKEKIPLNVKIFADTCMVVAPVKELGIKTLATDSAKGAHYTQNLSKIKSILKSREELLNE